MWIRFLIVGIVFFIAGMAVYWPVGSYGYVHYDDLAYVAENEHVLQGWTAASLKWAWTTNEQANWHPLTWMSHMLDCQLFGSEAPGRYHLVNVLLHVTNSLLLFVLLQQLTSVFWRPLLLAALFLVHPLHVESVAWISERKDVLSSLFWLASMIFYIQYVQRRSVGCYVVCCLLLAAGLLSKPMPVTAPFVLLLLDYWPLQRWLPLSGTAHRGDRSRAQEVAVQHRMQSASRKPSRRRKKNPRRTLDKANGSFRRATAVPDLRASEISVVRLWLEKVPLFLLVAVSSTITYFVQQGGGAVGSVPWQHHCAVIVLGYARYLRNTVWPCDLAVLYPNYPGMWTIPQMAAAVGLLAVVSAMVFIWRGKRYLTVGWLWFLGTLIPVIGIVQIGEHSLADRYMYFPLIGVLIMLAWGCADVLSYYSEAKHVGYAIVVVCCITCALVAFQQVSYWENSEKLFQRAVDVTKNNYSMHDKLGDELRRQGRAKDATYHYRRAVAIKPDFAEALNDLGVMLQAEGKITDAIEQYARSAQADPSLAEAYTNWGVALNVLGKPDQAIQKLQQALERKPRYAETLFNLGVVHQQQKRAQQASDYYQQAIEADSEYVSAYNNLGVLLQNQGQFQDALPYYQQALVLDSNYYDVYFNLGNGYRTVKQWKPSIAHYQRAIEIGVPSQSYPARVNLAVTLMEQRQWDVANRLLEQSLSLYEGDQQQQLANLLKRSRRRLPP
ncbi:MAG: tetratricopeptide repeat protein [Pirellulaceae bacterium]|nr:tetratricopeptide repeat protein [Pirellulaceae bacterium]